MDRMCLPILSSPVRLTVDRQAILLLLLFLAFSSFHVTQRDETPQGNHVAVSSPLSSLTLSIIQLLDSAFLSHIDLVMKLKNTKYIFYVIVCGLSYRHSLASIDPGTYLTNLSSDS